jgi:hypothetical protein
MVSFTLKALPPSPPPTRKRIRWLGVPQSLSGLWRRDLYLALEANEIPFIIIIIIIIIIELELELQ